MNETKIFSEEQIREIKKDINIALQNALTRFREETKSFQVSEMRHISPKKAVYNVVKNYTFAMDENTKRLNMRFMEKNYTTTTDEEWKNDKDEALKAMDRRNKAKEFIEMLAEEEAHKQ